jgi:hypothetical protein
VPLSGAPSFIRRAEELLRTCELLPSVFRHTSVWFCAKVVSSGESGDSMQIARKTVFTGALIVLATAIALVAILVLVH